MAVALLTNITSAANPYEGAPLPVPFRETRYNPRNVLSAYVWATAFGGKTVTLQVSPDYDPANPSVANWFSARRVDETQAIWTLADVESVLLRGSYMRLRATGVGNITALYGVIY